MSTMAHDMADMRHDMAPMGHAMPPSGALGQYSPTREASGTSWQPDESVHEGVHSSAGEWSLMAHAMLNLIRSRQSGLRGDSKTFVAGWGMASARRDFSQADTVNLRIMLTPEPLMGARGYPLLLAAGETADGATVLRDRQHPHDLFMELSASYSRRLASRSSAFLYVGLPGEPAVGPPAFMHRLSAMDSPEAPIGHHSMDSTHVTFGVVTGGLVHGRWKLEGSAFRGREPDQRRYGIETPRLDSASLRLSWNPTARLALQVSRAWLQSPEQLDPQTNERRSTASAIYTRRLGSRGWWSSTVAYARKVRSNPGVPLMASDAWLVESAARTGLGLTFFGRADQVRSDELENPVFPVVLPPVFLPVGFPLLPSSRATIEVLEPQVRRHVAGALPQPLRRVEKLSLGAVYDIPIAGHAKLGFGALYSFIRVPQALDYAYGPRPGGAMAFARLTIN